jgi:hypothetical protein
VIRVARNREPGVRLKDIAGDFGISESCLTNWLQAADVEGGVKPGATAADPPSCAPPTSAPAPRAGERGPSPGRVSVAGEPAGKMMYPLVREPAVDGIPVLAQATWA